jgi:hypothetical protein
MKSIFNDENLQIKKEKVFNFYMDNPCLSQDIDYENDSKRKIYYRKEVNALNENQLSNIMESLEIN